MDCNSGSSTARLATLSAFVLKAGSSAKSGRSMASTNVLN